MPDVLHTCLELNRPLVALLLPAMVRAQRELDKCSRVAPLSGSSRNERDANDTAPTPHSWSWSTSLICGLSIWEARNVDNAPLGDKRDGICEEEQRSKHHRHMEVALARGRRRARTETITRYRERQKVSRAIQCYFAWRRVCASVCERVRVCACVCVRERGGDGGCGYWQ